MISNRNLATVINATANLFTEGLTNLIVVFDIDSTLLFNTSGGNGCHGVLFTEVMRLYNFVASLNIPIYLITARLDTPDGRSFTLGQLNCLGIAGFSGLFLRPASAGMSVHDISIYKLQCRDFISSQTRKTIFLNVGDQWSDHYVCDEVKMQELNQIYGANNILFSPPNNAFSKWSLKLAAD
jgi:hypothetical protein